MRVSTFYSVTITRKDWEICYNYRRKIIGKRVCIVSISLYISSRSPTGSLPLVMHLANGQTMPVLPGPPVQMPSVISVSSVVGAANPTNTRTPPFHLNAHKHT